MQTLNNIINTGNDLLWGSVLIVALILVGLFFSFKTKFVQFRLIGEMFRLLGDGVTNKSENNDNKVSSFQAFCISTASRVGTGNIAGVSTAIAVGGPGSVFWMWLIALVGGASSFVESTLAQVYKVKDGDGYRGGPAYYMEKGLNNRGMGILFSILITIAFGFVFNSVQSNTIATAFNNSFGFDKTIMGVILVILTSSIIFGGVQRIAKVSEAIVPVFAVLYIIVSLFVVGMNVGMLPEIFTMIFKGAFGMEQVAGGAIGATIVQGVKRGLFSNEAGMGSAPNAAATADVSHPVKQGLIQTLGVFTDTIVICTCTAFIILISGEHTSGVTGIELTQNALTGQIGQIGSIFLSVCIFLFAFSSIIGNYYYGQSNIEFISTNKNFMLLYRVIVLFMVMFGALTEVAIVWNMADLSMGLMALVNLVAIVILSKIAFQVLEDYEIQKKSGIIDPVFEANKIEGLVGVDCWGNNRKIK